MSRFGIVRNLVGGVVLYVFGVEYFLGLFYIKGWSFGGFSFFRVFFTRGKFGFISLEGLKGGRGGGFVLFVGGGCKFFRDIFSEEEEFKVGKEVGLGLFIVKLGLKVFLFCS